MNTWDTREYQGEYFDTETEQWIAGFLKERCDEHLALYSDPLPILAASAGVFDIVARDWLAQDRWTLRQALRVFDGLGLEREL